MAFDESERRKCQSRTAFKYEEDKNHDSSDNEDIKTVKDFAYLGSVINSNGNCSQEIKERLRLGSSGKLGKVFKSKDVSLETKTKITYTLYSQLLCTNVKVGQ